MERIALSHPSIGFRLIHNNKTLIDSYPESNKDRIKNILGQQTNLNLLPLSAIDDHTRIYGSIGTPQISAANRKKLYMFINGRPIYNHSLAVAIKSVYGSLLDARRYPTAVIYINIPEAMVDVNVHPQKRIVTMSNEHKVIELLKKGIQQTLKKHNLMYHAANSSVFQFNKALSNQLLSSSPAWTMKSISVKNNYSVMQFDSVYLIVDTGNEILLVDQHAAHERILFNQYKNNFDKAVTHKSTQTLKPAKVIKF